MQSVDTDLDRHTFGNLYTVYCACVFTLTIQSGSVVDKYTNLGENKNILLHDSLFNYLRSHTYTDMPYTQYTECNKCMHSGGGNETIVNGAIFSSND